MDERILIVDDEEDIRVVLGISLSDLGYEVYTAENGENALQIIREVDPPIVLTDIRMPVMDGIDLLRRVKREHPETEVIMITWIFGYQLISLGNTSIPDRPGIRTSRSTTSNSCIEASSRACWPLAAVIQ